jgi:pilus assembly protein Flp/PilA
VLAERVVTEERPMQRFLRFIRDEDGPTAVEYAVMLALIIGSCLVAIGFFGTTASGSWQDTSSKLSSSMGS